MLLFYQSIFSYLVFHREHEFTRHFAFLKKSISSQKIHAFLTHYFRKQEISEKTSCTRRKLYMREQKLQKLDQSVQQKWAEQQGQEEQRSQSKEHSSGQEEFYVQRKYKDRLFRRIFHEHQSSFNPNMPLRFLQYIAREYEKLLKGKSLYYANLVKIPTPRFVVFYNGKEKQPAEQILLLSDAFRHDTKEPELELKVRVLNINRGNNEELLNQCKALKEYMEYVDRVRLHQRSMELSAAVERAVDECIKEGILSDFLSRNRSEAIKMSIFECDEEEIMRGIREDVFEHGLEKGRSEGRTEGRTESILDLLNERGTIPEELRQSILQESNSETLRKWLKLAAKVDSIEEFISLKN